MMCKIMLKGSTSLVPACQCMGHWEEKVAMTRAHAHSRGMRLGYILELVTTTVEESDQGTMHIDLIGPSCFGSGLPCYSVFSAQLRETVQHA